MDKALTLLWAFEGSPAEVGVVELAGKVGLSPSSVSRLLSSLVGGGLIDYNQATGRYRLGVGLVRLASLVTDRLDLRSTARPHLQALVDGTRETAYLSIFGGDQALTIDFIPSPRAVVSLVQLGRPSPVHCTAVGKLLLAHQPEAVQRRALAGPLHRFTPRTIVGPEALRLELERIRADGYAAAEEEREPELNAIAAPIFGPRCEAVAALGVQGPAYRFDRPAMMRALGLLRLEAEALSRKLTSARRDEVARR
ncbi:MAG: IclR family transcriptional regulator [Chloroflexi bacterium]|nr:IclR family transcriptional regulator [Chloroflexota bacterium]